MFSCFFRFPFSIFHVFRGDAQMEYHINNINERQQVNITLQWRGIITERKQFWSRWKENENGGVHPDWVRSCQFMFSCFFRFPFSIFHVFRGDAQNITLQWRGIITERKQFWSRWKENENGGEANSY
jgi:hypothetical protein